MPFSGRHALAAQATAKLKEYKRATNAHNAAVVTFNDAQRLAQKVYTDTMDRAEKRHDSKQDRQNELFRWADAAVAAGNVSSANIYIEQANAIKYVAEYNASLKQAKADKEASIRQADAAYTKATAKNDRL